MNLLRLLCLLAAVALVGCGPNPPGPTGEPAPGPEADVIDEAMEAEANAASEGEAP